MAASRKPQGRVRFQMSPAEVVERSPAIPYVTKREGAMLWTTERFVEILGIPASEWVGDPDIWVEHLHPDDRERVLAEADAAAQAGGRFETEYRMIRADGTTTWVRDIGDYYPDPSGTGGLWHGVLLPIDRWKEREHDLELQSQLFGDRDRLRLEELKELNEMLEVEAREVRRMLAELRVSERRARALLEQLPCVTYEWTAGVQPRFTASPRVADAWAARLIAPLTQDEEEWLSAVHPDDRERVRRLVTDHTRLGEAYEETYRVLTVTGESVWILERSEPIEHAPDGSGTRYVGILLDVTASLEAGHRQRVVELRYRVMAGIEPGIVYTRLLEADAGGVMVHVSAGIRDLLGFDPDDWIGHTLSDFADPEQAPALRDELHRLLLDHRPLEARVRLRHADGRYLPFRLLATTAAGAGGVDRLLQGVLLPDPTEPGTSD